MKLSDLDEAPMKLSDLDSPPAKEEPSKQKTLSDLIVEDAGGSKLVAAMKPSTAAGAFRRGAERSALPTAAGIAAFPSGFMIGAGLGSLTGPAAPVVSPVLGVIGGIATSFLGTSIATGIQNRFLNMMPTSWREKIGMDLEQQLADEKQHPLASFFGETAPNLATARAVKPKAIGMIAGAAAGGAMEAGREVMSGEGIDLSKIGIAAAEGALPTKATRTASKFAKATANNPVGPAVPATQAERTFGEHLTSLYDDQQNKLADDQLKKWQAVKPVLKSKDYNENMVAMYHAWDQGKGGMIGKPEAQKISKQTIQPLQKEVDTLRQRIKQYGVDVGEDVQHYMPRILETEAHGTVLDSLGKAIDPAHQGKSFSTWSRHFQDRQAVMLTGEKGWQTIGVRDPETGMVQLWHNGKVTSQYKVEKKDWQSGEFMMGKEKVKRGQASVEQIEANTPLRYVKDPIRTLMDTRQKMANVLQNLEYLEALKHDPRFASVAVDAKKAYQDPAYNKWRKVNGLPKSFDNTVFSPRIAERLEDIINMPTGHPWETVGRISRLITSTLFINPSPHINNVLWHAVVEKGLVGFFNPLTMPARMRNTVRAMKAVWTMNDEYHKWATEPGSGMMSPGVFLQHYKDSLAMVAKDPRANGLAEKWGYGTFENMSKRIWRAAQTSMWGVNDMILMKAYMDHVGSGQTAAQAVAQVNKHIPNYRIPPRIVVDNRFGRLLSQFLKDPSMIGFGRYEYGRLASYGNMVKDLLGKQSTKIDRAHALDQIAMLGFATFVLYPMLMDPMAKAITGNPNATAVRAGPTTIPFFLTQVYHNQADISQLPSRMFMVAPATQNMVEFAYNRDLFSGHPKYQDPKELAESIISIVPYGRDAVQIGEGKETIGQFAARAASISSPNAKQVAAANKRQAQRIREKAKRKGRSGE